MRIICIDLCIYYASGIVYIDRGSSFQHSMGPLLFFSIKLLSNQMVKSCQELMMINAAGTIIAQSIQDFSVRRTCMRASMSWNNG
jgi:hypothetical protein